MGDIDNDGDLDLIVTGEDNGGAPHLDKYINNGNGNFAGPTNCGTAVERSSIALGDIDNDGNLDLIVTGEDNGGTPHLDRYINNGTGSFSAATPFGVGVYSSSIALGDINNDNKLDLIVTGRVGANERLDKYINQFATANNSPSVPSGMEAIDSGGYWRFQWDAPLDDHTSGKMLRYQIAIGTGSGIYDYASACIDYPRGQANIGKVMAVSGTPYFQTKIPSTENIYWKVSAIDSAFKTSGYCAELATEQPETPGISVDVYNNHFDLSTEDKAYIVFGKSGKAEIKIYSFRGALIKHYDEKNYNKGEFVEWYGDYMDTDNKVSAGIYFVVVTGDIEGKMKLIVKN